MQLSLAGIRRDRWFCNVILKNFELQSWGINPYSKECIDVPATVTSIKYNNRKSRKLILFSRFPSFSALTQYRHTSGPSRSKAAINRINRLTRGYVLGTLIATVSRGKRFILSTANIIHRYLWINHLAPGVKTKAFNIIVSHRRVPSLRRKWKIKLRVCYS